MKKTALVAAALALAVLGFAFAGAVARGAQSHQSPCHSQHTCPSDDHTYVWTDQSTFFPLDCAEPGAREYDASRDTTVITYDGLTYYCRVAAAEMTSTLDTTTSTTATESTSTSTTTTVASTTTSTSTTPTTPGPGEPSIILPDPEITPGRLNTKVRQPTIKKTICKSGWTKRIRPPVSYTNALKLEQMVLYGETGSPAEYEEDHFIPLELGGAARNPKNLWPEPRSQSKITDPLETKLRRQVCKGVLTLKKARGAIRKFKNQNG